MAAPGGVLLVEWPLPWPRAIGDVVELGPVLDAAEGIGARVLLVTRDGRPADEHTVCWYRARVADPLVAAGFDPAERRCRRSEVVATALALLAGEPGAPVGHVDVAVCTHGRRDACCGGAGTSLYRALRAAPLPAGVRLWRSSHQGGHRFAPTALVLPDGTSWAHLDVATVLDVLRRDGSTAAVIDHYRGCVALADPALQALDGAALATAGWGWLDARRTGRRLAPGRMELVATTMDHDPLGRCEGVVGVGTAYQMPPCGAVPGSDVPLAEHHGLEVLAFRHSPSLTL